MKSKTSFNLIKYSSTPIDSGDFNGPESSLDLKGQIDYLNEYKKTFLEYSSVNFNKKIINRSEVNKILKEIKREENKFRNRRYLDNGVVTIKDNNPYQYLHFYGDKVELKKKSINLLDNDKYPCSSFDLFTPFEISKYSLKLKIDEKFITPLRSNIDTTMGGKYFELRNDINEILRVQFYSNGEVYLRTLEKDIYHYTNTLIASVDYKENIDIDFCFSNGVCTIKINKKEAFVSTSIKPNFLLFSSGQFPNGSSSITFKKVIDINKNEIDIFKENLKAKDIVLGKKFLPVTLGNFENHNKFLSYKTSFLHNSNKDSFLHVSSLNPGGEIYINHKLICLSDSYFTDEINVTSFVKNGENNIEVIVYPRSPENIITWHRNKDPYYASFIDEIYVEERNKTYIESAHVFTTSVKPIKANSKIVIKSEDKQEIVLKIYANQKNFYEKNMSLKRGTNILDVECEFKGLKLWDDKNPNLYDLKFELSNKTNIIDEFSIRYGFRKIEQKDGKFQLNGKDFVMKGALLMQYLPTYKDIVINHTCPTDRQIIEQFIIAKKMNSNTVRMHVLGYGNSELRYARIADFLGINIIWTTNYIDSLGSVIFNNSWKQKEEYIKEIKKVINNPSVIAYEGINEMALTPSDISLMYKEFVSSIKKVDSSRLLFPISHPYYGGDAYRRGGICGYIQEDGKKDQDFKPIKASKEWNDSLVVRSAHTYNWLLGYGTTWDELRKQSWSGQDALLKSKEHAYVVSEFAIIGRINPNKKKKEKFYNDKSYEYPDEHNAGYDFSGDYTLSQTYQLLCAKYSCLKMLSLDVDGLLWCSLISGANDGSYLKPVVDFNYYPKYAFEGLKECYSDIFISDNSTDVVLDKKHILKPTIFGMPDFKSHDIEITIKDKNGNKVYKKNFKVMFDKKVKEIAKIKPDFNLDGYYKIIYRYG